MSELWLTSQEAIDHYGLDAAFKLTETELVPRLIGGEERWSSTELERMMHER
ncbi:hypothetical protein [Nocardia sp. IFM 10818]